MKEDNEIKMKKRIEDFHKKEDEKFRLHELEKARKLEIERKQEEEKKNEEITNIINLWRKNEEKTK